MHDLGHHFQFFSAGSGKPSHIALSQCDRIAAAAAPYMQSFEEYSQTLYRNFMQQVQG
jgi:hypothetical protein